MLNYPIKFTPILKEKLWGGSKLKDVLHKYSFKDNIGESWEISDVQNEVSMVANGFLKGKSLKYLVENYKGDLVGNIIYKKFGTNFPLLIKFIDAKQNLSIQVHPNNELSFKRHQCFGKTEMWYVMQADKNAQLILDFNKKINPTTYQELVDKKEIMSVLNNVPVSKGDSFFIETGTIHAIGAGVLLAEIQQTSDITYRIFDFDRVDDEGNERELHTEQAIDAINFEPFSTEKIGYDQKINKLNKLVSCEFFKTNVLPVEGTIELDYTTIDSFVIFMCVEGNAAISIFGNKEMLNYGETILIPANAQKVQIIGKNCKLLEVTI
ncbi:type I phosphomannose isomerase catalytic subunit [Lutibacter sp.]|uniref:type I phosphomannose isomerase catalytic subunit n=1 Tax=Lutibacter sp. TaxID=1925666 RepID=UPI002732E60C|nr:type I phosphomannose isomerase catalytic subunit [Lutibacter sp.]MDP3312120.1 mannose-6-phosphate isomerase [Lutibacter sp.]